jgi:tRNA(adenine34) deaminase
MWESLSPPWQACLELAWEACCDDCYPIGAVVVGADGAILSKGRNRVYPQRRWTDQMPGVDLAHAEVEALHSLNFAGIDPHVCALYTSLEPCPMCLGTFYMSGLRTIHYAAREPYAGSIELLGTTRYLSKKKIQVSGPYPELEVILTGLSMEQERHCHPGLEKESGFYQLYSQVLPEGMEAGEQLFRSGLVRELMKKGACARETFEAIAAFLDEEPALWKTK